MQYIVTIDNKWDQYFMSLAYLVSMRSKDPSTRVGAVIVGVDHEIRATGYNGLPRSISDAKERYEDKQYKYLASNHAEENAIIQCARVGTAIKGSTIYTIWAPCAQCSKMIIQAGIVRVVYDQNFPGNHTENQKNWEYSINLSLEILTEAKVEINAFNGKLLTIEGLYQGKNFDL